MLGLLAPGVGMGGTPVVAPSFTWIFRAGGAVSTATDPLRVQAAQGHVAMAEAMDSHVAGVAAQDAHVAGAEAMEGRER